MVVALGNPGPEYSSTRHNAGWRLADRLCRVLGAPSFTRVRLGFLRGAKALWASGAKDGVAVCLLKPTGYMNRSGPPSLRVMRHLGLEPTALLALADDVHLPVGRARMRPGGGAGGHNGLRSLMDSLGTREFARLRVGVGAPGGGDLADWVLSPPSPADRQAEADLMPWLVDAALAWATSGLEAGQAALAAKPPAPPSP